MAFLIRNLELQGGYIFSCSLFEDLSFATIYGRLRLFSVSAKPQRFARPQRKVPWELLITTVSEKPKSHDFVAVKNANGLIASQALRVCCSVPG